MKYDIYILPEKLVNFRVRAGEQNASGNNRSNRIRSVFEFEQLYKNYLKINGQQEFLRVFPETSVYFGEKQNNDIK